MYDVLNNISNLNISCLDKGHVRLVDTMPRLVPEETKTSDFAIVQAARVSYGDGTKTVNEDRGLIRYLMRHSHTTPFEMVEFKFHCKMPIFVARQWIRHRTASVNELSGRYSILKDEFHIPSSEDIRQQSNTNKQGGIDRIDVKTADDFLHSINNQSEQAYHLYSSALSQGVTREQARMILSLNLYTEWYWKIDLHNLLHFLALRCHHHSQHEIQVFANAMLSLINPIVPITIEAWNDYHPMREAIKLSRLEIDAIKNNSRLNSDNKREQSEWEEKARKLGILINN